MRLLALYQARDSAMDQPGFFQAFGRMVDTGMLEAHSSIPYLGIAETRGWPALWDEAHRTAKEMEADVIFLQFFHARMPDPTLGIQRLKSLSHRPLIVSSLGDPFGRWNHRVPRSFRVASGLSDVSFLTGMGYIARQLAGWGSRNLVLMPNGCCQVRFSGPITADLSKPDFDVSFVGNRMRSMNPFSHFYWVGRKRVEFVAAVTKRYGKRFGLFGKGWFGNSAWQGPIPYVSQHSAYQSSAVVLGGMPGAYNDYYTSDRVFIAVASGVPLVDYWVRGVDRILEPERDWWLARDLKEMLRLCDKLLEMPADERIAAAQQTRQRILSEHTQYHRCAQMIEIVKGVQDARRQGRAAAQPELAFLRPSQEPEKAPKAILNWCG